MKMGGFFCFFFPIKATEKANYKPPVLARRREKEHSHCIGRNVNAYLFRSQVGKVGQF